MPSTYCFVGCLTRGTPYYQGVHGKGIAVLAFDEETGGLTLLSEYAGVDNPTYLTVDPSRGTVYANSEVFEWNEGDVTALRFDTGTGRLVYLNRQPTLGNITAYNSLDRSGRHLLVANYGWGDVSELPGQAVAVFPIREDGGLAPPVASAAHSGTGPNPERQERPHPHSVLATPDDRFVVVADLGIDQLVSYRFDAARGTLERAGSLSLPPGSGPRHFVFHPNRKLAFLIAELGSTIYALRFDEAAGTFSIVDQCPAVPPEAAATNHCADIHLSPDGRYLYGSNRGHDSLVILAVDATTGALRHVGWQSTLGSTPRNFAIAPSGRHILVANQNSDEIVVFLRDPETGLLTDSGQRASLGTPLCVKLARL